MEVPFGPSFKKTIGEYIEVEAGMGLFLEGSVAGFELATTRKQSTWTWNRLNIDIDDLLEMSQNPAGFTPHNKYITKLVMDTTEYSVTGPGQMSVGIGAFAKVEATFAIPLEKTPNFIQKTVKAFTSKTDTLGFGAEVGVEAGVRLEANVPFWTVLGKQGGTQIVTIDSTNVESIAIGATSDGITATLSGNKLTITVSPNSGEAYTSHVIVEGKTKYGLTGSAFIEISQDGTAPVGPQPGAEISLQYLSIRPAFNYNVNITKDDDDNDDGRDYMGNKSFYATEGDFTSLTVTEDDINSNLFEVSATIVDDHTIHVSCQGGPKQYYQYVSTPWCDGCPDPSWISRHDVSFDIIKLDPYTYTIANVTLSEQGEWKEDDNNYATKSGSIVFSPADRFYPCHGFLNPGDDETGAYYDFSSSGTTNALRTYWKANKLNVTAYSFEYDGQRIGNDNHFREKTFRKHATFTYEQSDFEDFYFNIIFKDGEAFSDWIKR